MIGRLGFTHSTIARGQNHDRLMFTETPSYGLRKTCQLFLDVLSNLYQLTGDDTAYEVDFTAASQTDTMPKGRECAQQRLCLKSHNIRSEAARTTRTRCNNVLFVLTMGTECMQTESNIYSANADSKIPSPGFRTSPAVTYLQRTSYSAIQC